MSVRAHTHTTHIFWNLFQDQSQSHKSILCCTYFVKTEKKITSLQQRHSVFSISKTAEHNVFTKVQLLLRDIIYGDKEGENNLEEVIVFLKTPNLTLLLVLSTVWK